MENKSKYDLPSVESLLEAGSHFGHQSRRWNPLMKKYIYGMEGRTHIINMFKTLENLEKACDFLYETAKEGKQIVVVGSKRQASFVIERLAPESGALYVSQRWLGGTFTNFESVKRNWEELNRLKLMRERNELTKYTKKERLLIDRKIEKLETFVGGINGMKKYPGAMIVIDVKREKTAVREANAVGVPIIAIIDTNGDPSSVKYPIPANDDAIKSLELLFGALNSAIKEGYKAGKDPEKIVKPETKVAEPVIKKFEPEVVKTKETIESKPSNKKVTDEKEVEAKVETVKVTADKVAEKAKEKTVVKDEKAIKEVKKESLKPAVKKIKEGSSKKKAVKVKEKPLAKKPKAKKAKK